MRPGQSCPGVGGAAHAVFMDTTSFNEAGAIMPRSGSIDRTSPAGAPTDCFNEAGAIMPRSGRVRARARSRARYLLQ